MSFNLFIRYLLKNISLGYFSVFLKLIVSLFSLPIFILNIGIDNFSNWSIIYSTVILSSLIDLGSSRYISNSLPNLKDNNSKETLIAKCLLISIISYFLLCIILYSITNLFGGNFERLNNLNIETKLLLLTNLFFFLFLSILRGILEGLYKLHLSTILNTFFNNISLIIVVMLSFYFNSILLFFLIYSVFSFVNLILHIYFANKYISLKFKFFNIYLIFSTIKKTIPFSISSLIENIFFILIRLILFEFSDNKNNIGYFEIVSKICNLFKLVGSSISRIFFTYFSDNNINYYYKNKFIIYHLSIAIPFILLIIISYINFGDYLFINFFLFDINNYYYSILAAFISFSIYGFVTILFVYFLSLRKFKTINSISLISFTLSVSALLNFDFNNLNIMLYSYSTYVFFYSISLIFIYFYKKNLTK